MLTVGVDLAAEPKGTALAEVRWDGDGASGTAHLERLVRGVSNDDIAEAALRAVKVGIDCAFGWPDEFVAFVGAHSQGLPLDPPADHGIAWRRRLAYRETDRDVQRRTGRHPLSVATDRLGLTAMRCAVILHQLAGLGIDTDRSGSGRVAEVYPAASLGVWGITTAGSKRDAVVLGRLAEQLAEAAPWLDLCGWMPVMRESHDAFDAVIAALAARGSALGQTSMPPPELQDQAEREGWIALTQGGIGRLVESSTGPGEGSARERDSAGA